VNNATEDGSVVNGTLVSTDADASALFQLKIRVP
jgi:hypothetical protein